MTENPTRDGVDTRDGANDPGALVTGLSSIALAVLVAGTLLDRFAGLEAAYLISRVAAAPVILVALVIGVRRRAGRRLIWPAILLALVVSTFVAEL